MHSASWLVVYRLMTRKEKEIAVVTHSGFLVHTLTKFGNDCLPLMKDDMSTRYVSSRLSIATFAQFWFKYHLYQLHNAKMWFS